MSDVSDEDVHPLRERLHDAIDATGRVGRGLTVAGQRLACLDVADAVIADLGLQASGSSFCPVHGNALCPEQYMLRQDGSVAVGYREHWTEDMRCGERQRLYRVALFGSIETS